MGTHAHIVAARDGRSLSRDDYRRLHRDVRALCPDAWDRLDRFYWDLVADLAFEDPGWGDEAGPFEREAAAREWLAFHKWPHSPGRHIDWDGVEHAATAAAAALQATLHRLREEKLDLGAAYALHAMRAKYLTPMIRSGGNKLAKQMERSAVEPGTELLAICIGGKSDKLVTVMRGTGRTETRKLCHVPGCGRLFEDPPLGPGTRWPMWCKPCGEAKSNAASRQTTDLRDRYSRAY